LSGRGLCDELITRPEESYRQCCVVVCDLETSRLGAPYIYNVRLLRVNAFPERISPLSTHFGSCNAKCVVIIFKERDFRDSISENLHDLWENIAYYSQHTSPVLKGERQL